MDPFPGLRQGTGRHRTNRIHKEVVASRADDLDFGEVLARADQFNISGGKYTETNQVYVLAQSKDKKLRIQFDVEGHRSLLSKVSFFYQ